MNEKLNFKRFVILGGKHHLILALLSAFAILSLSAKALPPANDDYSHRQLLIGDLPLVVEGTTDEATPETLESDHGHDFDGNRASNSVWWEWQATVDQVVSVEVREATFDSVITVYSGETLASLQVVVASDLAGSGEPERVFIRGITGQRYAIVVDGHSDTRDDGNETGGFELHFEAHSPPDNDAFSQARTLSASLPIGDLGTTLGASAQESEPNHANADRGNLASGSVWWRWLPAESGAVVASCYQANFDAAIAVYRGETFENLILIGEADTKESGEIEKVSFEADDNTVYYIAVDANSTDLNPSSFTGKFEIALTRPPHNDNYANSQDLGNALKLTSIPGSTIGTTAEPGEPDHANAEAGNRASTSTWFAWTAPTTTTIGIEVEGPALDAVVAIYTGDALETLTAISSSDRHASGIAERVKFPARAGRRYAIAVDGFTDTADRAFGYEALFTLSLFEAVPNDDFEDGIDLTQRDFPILEIGTTLNANGQFDAGEPDHALEGFANLSSNSVWYRWKAPSTMQLQVTVIDPAFDAVLAVYQGTEMDSLSLIDTADLGQAGHSEVVRIKPLQGKEYHIAIDGWSDDGNVQSAGVFALELVVPMSVEYQHWIANYPSLVANDTLPHATPAGDGLPNLMKRALGLDPSEHSSLASQRERLPKFTSIDGTRAMMYQLAPESERKGMRITGQSSLDLKTWIDTPSLAFDETTLVIPIPELGDTQSYLRLIAYDEVP